MIPQKWVNIFQFAGAALGIPAAAAGTWNAYQNYFSNDAACHKLRTNIISTMERKLAHDIKRSLLRKDVVEFDKNCGESDPDARTVFEAALMETEPQMAMSATRSLGGATPARPKVTQADADVGMQRRQLAAFGAPGSEPQGWVAIGRQHAGAWSANFTGYAITADALPPKGTVLSAQHRLPVWSQMQGESNDNSKLQSLLPSGACVRVLSTRHGAGRLWAEVAPATCS
jgi:hypothetical protein